jgi:hypothetical protein
MVTTRSPRVEVGDVDKNVPESGCRLEWYSSSPRAWLTVNLWVGLLVYTSSPWVMLVTALPSQCWQWNCRVLLVMTLSRRCWSWRDVVVWVLLAMALPKRCWLWCDVVVESYYRWCYWVLLTMTLSRRRCLWADVTAVEAGFVDQANALLAVVLPPPDVWDERDTTRKTVY